MSDPISEEAAKLEKELRLKALLSMKLAQEKALAKENEKPKPTTKRKAEGGAEPTKAEPVVTTPVTTETARPEPRVIKTTAPVKSDAQRAGDRSKRFKAELDKQDEEAAAEDLTQQGYFDDFSKVVADVVLGGKWRFHYDGTGPDDLAFREAVDRTGKSLARYITDVVQTVDRANIHFRAGDSTTYPGQLSTFTIRLAEVSGAGFKNTTIAGGVTASQIDIFHAGPGS